jgi:hypothetical protein
VQLFYLQILRRIDHIMFAFCYDTAPVVRCSIISGQLMLLIHLSDIHFRKGEVGTAMDPNAHLRRELLSDAVAQCGRIGAVPDAVLVSGDVAFGGDPDEYAYALSWLDELCRGLSTTLSSVFVIPGNHDVLRGVASRTLIQTIHRAIKSTNDIALDSLLRGLLSEEESSRLLYEALGPYNSFAGQFFCDLLPPERTIARRDLFLNVVRHGFETPGCACSGGQG